MNGDCVHVFSFVCLFVCLFLLCGLLFALKVSGMLLVVVCLRCVYYIFVCLLSTAAVLSALLMSCLSNKLPSSPVFLSISL